MTVVEHLAELRTRIIISVVAVSACAAFCYWFAPDIIQFFLNYYKDATHGDRDQFIFTGPLDAFVTRIKVATYGGIVLALPILLWQLWRFITPGLNPKEKRYAIPFVFSSILLFAAGGFVAMLTLPEALNFLLRAGGDQLSPLLEADRYLSLVALMIVAFGIAFEFPVVLVFLLLARVLTTRQLRNWRRWAIGPDRRLRSRDHAEPGPVLSVLHGHSHVSLLRGEHRHREGVEAMTRSRHSPTKYRRPRDRHEVVVAVLAALAILVVTAVMVWVLGPHDDGGGGSTSTTTVATVPDSTADTTATSTPADTTPASSTPTDSSTPPASSG